MKNKLLIFLVFLFFIPLFVSAKEITENTKITIDNNVKSKLTDKNENTYIDIKKGQKIKITNDDNIYGIYIIYEMKSVKGRLSNYTREIEIGTNSFLHEYLNVDDLVGNSKELELTYNEDVKIGEIYIFDNGELPDFVEIWSNSCEKADLLLFSTHSDDEQLFFAGLMPTYIAKGACVQVVYFTNHNDNPKRLHEQIHGLYKIGIRNYPIIGIVPDAWSNTLKWAKENLKKANLSEDDVLKFEVEMLRRFKPLVVVGHDENGEYSHGQHMLNTYILKEAIEKSNDSSFDNGTIEKYGLWDTPKTYLHLYKGNKITLDYDTPLDYFNGKTAYEVSKLGYSEHHSQQYTWFTKWLTGVDSKGKGTPYTKATEIKTYSPCEYGLYRSLVGEDINKNDMFENLTLRKDEKKEEPTININDNVEEKIIDKKELSIEKYTTYIYIGIIFITIITLLIRKK